MVLVSCIAPAHSTAGRHPNTPQCRFFGETLHLNNCTGLHKTAGRAYIRAREPGGRRPWMLHEWHQDMGVTTEEAYQSEIVTCWIPLVDVSQDMGALQIFARRRELLRTTTGGRGGLIFPHALPPRPPLTLELAAGDVLLISAFTPHRSTPNQSDSVRWSVDLRFQSTGTHSGRAQLPSFVVRSAREPGLVDTDFDAWCAKWVAATGAAKGSGQ